MTRARNKWQTATFVAWDGEGVTVKGRHRYVMLRNSEHAGVTDGKGLTTKRCLDALLAGIAATPNAWHVGFAFSYDVNMIVGSFARPQLARLHAGRWVAWRNYRLRYRRAKSFTVQRHTADGWRGGTIWDTFGFFQSSFVRACEAYDIGAPHVRAAVAAMKTARSAFRASDLAAIESYCESECELLVQLMWKLKSYFEEAGLKVNRWDGAGAVAAALMQREGVKAMKSAAPDAVQDAVQYAFAGGRIELIQYGHAPNTEIHHYDLNSAYPAALEAVPCLSHGEWRHSTDRGTAERASHARAAGTFGVHRVRWHFATRHSLLPFFWRAPDGRILYPRSGEGWYWSPELASAIDFAHAVGGRLELIESWTWRPSCAHRPFGFIPLLFAQRLQWKRDGRGAEKVLKLGLNSLYGKCAQHVGGSADDGPAWHQLEWAGWTTSWTRAALFRAAWRAAERGGLIALATDGIYSLLPLPWLAIGAGLGEWSYQVHRGMTIVQSGVYWLDDHAPVRTTPFHRGFDAGSIQRDKVLAAWRAGKSSITAKATRFIGMGQALAGGDMMKKWRQWLAAPRELELTPLGTKRMLDLRFPRASPDRTLHPTVPYDRELEQLPMMSTAAHLPWRPLPGPLPLPSDVDSDDAVL